MPSTLSLSCSKKLYELLGETYETESFHEKRITDEVDLGNGTMFYYYKKIPLPSFSETIRLLPRIAEKKGWAPFFAARIASLRVLMQDAKQVETVASHCVELYIHAYTEEEGMEQVSNYLEALL